MDATIEPWYRHKWPWLLMAGPAAVIVAGVATSVIAFTGADGVVADDYYKRGLGINRELARELTAEQIGLRAVVTLRGGTAVAVIEASEALPDRVQLTLAHPTRAGLDRKVYLARAEGVRYEAPLGALPDGRWRVILETPRWRWSALAESGR
jgi:hypothetical protein